MAHLRDLTSDPRNARKHNPRNIGMIADLLQSVGAARSIVIDEDDVILAGNGVAEAAAQAGIENVRIIDADGDELIAVRRSNLTPKQKAKLSVGDNRSAELAFWDGPVVESLIEDELIDPSAFWYEPELDRLLNGLDTTPFDPAAEWQGMPEFAQEDQSAVKQLTVNFASEADVEAFARAVDQVVTMSTKSIWFPRVANAEFHSQAYVKVHDDAA